MQPEQNLANHTRFHPPFHFVLLPILASNVIVRIVLAVRSFSALAVWDAIIALAIVFIALFARFYGLRNQDRIIRLEERLRLERILPDDLRARVGELRTRQLIGLRFCSDDELADACRAALAEKADTKAIKQRVRNWRPDYMRL